MANVVEKKHAKNLTLKGTQSSDLTLSNTPFLDTNLLEFYQSPVNRHKCIGLVISSFRAYSAIPKMADGIELFRVCL